MQIEITPQSRLLGWVSTSTYEPFSMGVLSTEIYQIQSRTSLKKEHPDFLSYLIIYIQTEIVSFNANDFSSPWPSWRRLYTQHWIRIETLQLLNNNRYMNSIAATNSLQIYHVLYFMLNATQ